MNNSIDGHNSPRIPNSGQELGNKCIRPATTCGNLARFRHRVQRDTRKYFQRTIANHYMFRIQRRGRREWFRLQTDLAASAMLAREIETHLRFYGWEATRKKFKPSFESENCDLTVGGFVELVTRYGEIQPMTLSGYISAFRRIVAGAFAIDRGYGKIGRKPKEWRHRVDAVSLRDIKVQHVLSWRDKHLECFPLGSLKRMQAEHTANSAMRSAHALFSKRVLRRLFNRNPNLMLPMPLPLDGIELLPERESDFFYVSEIDASKLIKDAFQELKGNCLIIFILALGAGLRRNEIDKLPMAHLNLSTGIVTVAPTQHHRLKTDTSAGKVQLEQCFVEKLRELLAHQRGEFVLTAPFPRRLRKRYRCKEDFRELNLWLRGKGITHSVRRIHTLRKEFGSHLAQRRGIFAASAGLRHSTIGITRKFYAANPIQPTAFLTPLDAIPIESEIFRLIQQLSNAVKCNPPMSTITDSKP